MSSKLNIEDAQANLQQLFAGLNPGELLTIVEDGQPVATPTRSSLRSWPCKAGSVKGTPHRIALNFNAPLEIDHTRLSEKTS
jgi:hypothetical protein